MKFLFLKQILLFSVFGLIKTTVFSQVKIEFQPDTSYYSYVVNTICPFAITEKETITLKAQPLPIGLIDTLKKYDWFDMGGYNYMEGKFASKYVVFRDLLGGDSKQLDFIRFCNNGVIGMFYLQKTTQNIKTVFTNTFDKATATKLVGLKKVGAITYMENEDFGEKMYTQIISYKNKKLVVDITKYGKIAEKPVKYRMVYYAIPQQFNWEIK